MRSKYLSEFDSKIFNKKVYKFNLGDNFSASTLKRVKGPAIICVFSEFNYRDSALLKKLGYNLISIRNTYRLTNKPTSKVINKYKIYSLSEGLPTISGQSIIKMARLIGSTSRYFKDPQMLKKSSLNLYINWIENSLFKGYAGEAFYIVNGKNLAGMVTLKIKGRRGFIDLIGVDAKMQGKGIGKMLMARAFDFFAKHKISDVRVITEGENIQANSFYQKMGFIVQNVQLVYHKHLH